MVDVFISYKREERAKAKLLAEALTKKDLVVWWDAQALSFEKYDEQIKSAIDQATVFIVLWSSLATTSNWVKAETTYANRKGRVIHIAIDPIASFDLPLEFTLEQCHDLSDWDGSVDHEILTPIFKSILIAKKETDKSKSVPQGQKPKDPLASNIPFDSSDIDKAFAAICGNPQNASLTGFLNIYGKHKNLAAVKMATAILEAQSEEEAPKGGWLKNKGPLVFSGILLLAAVLAILSDATFLSKNIKKEEAPSETNGTNINKNPKTHSRNNHKVPEIIEPIELTPIVLCQVNINIPAKFKTVTTIVIHQEASTEFVTAPAVFETVIDTVIIRPHHNPDAELKKKNSPVFVQEQSNEYIAVPTTYETRTEIAFFSGYDITKEYYYRAILTPASVHERTIPGITKGIDHYIIVNEGTQTKDGVIPAITMQMARRRVKTSASTAQRIIPAVTKEISAKIETLAASTIKKTYICDIETHPFLMGEIQKVLLNDGIYQGKTTSLSSETFAEYLRKYQKKKGLSQVGKPTTETLKAMKIDYSIQ